MPFAPHIRCTALGRLGTSGERFQYGLNLATPDGNGMPVVAPGSNDAFFDDIAATFRDLHISLTNRISSVAIIQEVKFATIGADGKYVEDPYISPLTEGPGGVTVDSNSALVPFQSALAISLNTARRGPTGKGRFYLPMPVIPLDAAGLCNLTMITDIAARMALSIAQINDQPGIDSFPGLKVCVASSKGYNSPVSSVRVGRVLDTIRSRRAQLAENYTPDVVLST